MGQSRHWKFGVLSSPNTVPQQRLWISGNVSQHLHNGAYWTCLSSSIIIVLVMTNNGNNGVIKENNDVYCLKFYQVEAILVYSDEIVKTCFSSGWLILKVFFIWLEPPTTVRVLVVLDICLLPAWPKPSFYTAWKPYGFQAFVRQTEGLALRQLSFSWNDSEIEVGW